MTSRFGLKNSLQMVGQLQTIDFGPAADVTAGPASADVLIVCEHASNAIPEGLSGLGLDAIVRQSHVAWDPGALGVAKAMANSLGAGLVAGTISRLVYDCNRPPDAPSAMPRRSEVFDIPGNLNLSAEARQARVDGIYQSFHDALAGRISANLGTLRLLLTVHSFTPTYHGQHRPVELGLLHGADDRFARAMLSAAPDQYVTLLNEPYSAADGVAHTLDLHGAGNGLLNVMIEIRNDLIVTPQAQADMAAYLAPWVRRVLDEAQV